MTTHPDLTRRGFLARTGPALLGVAGAVRCLPGVRAATVGGEAWNWVRGIRDPVIREGVGAAIDRNLLAAATEHVYPGHFTINADGGGYGSDSTWPGLDSWQMTGAYLLLGRTRLVLDYFAFVRASQRADGNIPFAIFNGDTRPGGCLRGLKHPQDLFTWVPPKRDGAPASSQQTRQWIGLFEHWQTQGLPLSTLGPVSYLLTAIEIHDTTRSRAWVTEYLPSLESAARFLLSMRNRDGLIGGSGFYVEAPPREGCDGVTQCYATHAFRGLARLYRTAGDRSGAGRWTAESERLARAFRAAFWRGDHFGEYVHPTRGLVDLHGLSEVNWAAVAFELAGGRELRRLWPRLLSEPGFHAGGMPTQLVTKPFSYEAWESSRSADCGVDPLNDVAAMGRVWYLEALACRRMESRARLLDSVRMVCEAARPDGFWRERYHLKPDGTLSPDGSKKYCEYAAVLVRVVLGNRALFRE